MKIFDLFKKSEAYDFNSVDGISKIQIPKYPKLEGIQSPSNNIEYILQRKATEHKKNGRMDLAIACLRKSNEIMPYSNFSYPTKDYMRLIKYLEKDGQIDAARFEENKLRTEHPELFDQRIGNKERINNEISKALSYGEDIVEILTNSTCPICKKYNHKKYSISGISKKYKKIPDEFVYHGGFDEKCIIDIVIDFNL